MLKACKAFVAYKSMSAIPGYLRDSLIIYKRPLSKVQE